MKTYRGPFLYLMSILTFLVSSCTEETLVKMEKVQFALELSTPEGSDGGRIKSASEIPPGATLRVSIETSTGQSILTLEDIELLHVGGSVITAPLELSAGSYNLTDFLIVSEDNEILFATPRRGSSLEKYVINPLKVNFSVSSGQVKNIPMEVIDVAQSTPEAFGYLSFNINVVHPLQIAVFITTPAGIQLTSALLTIEKGAPVVQTVNLYGQVNKVAFKQDPELMYKLRITKAGYLAYERDFIYSDLMEELSNGTLNVTLQPGMTIITPYYYPNSYGSHLSFSVGPGITAINWGDGTIETSPSGFSHTYSPTAPGKRYTIHLTGNLSNVSNFYGFYNDANFESFDLSLLTGLKDFTLGLALTPKVVDLSKSTNLNTLYLVECRGTENVVAPISSELRNVGISGLSLNTAVVSSLIDRIHSNAVLYEIYDGQFDLRKTTFPDGDEERNLLAGPPTPQALEKLRQLRDIYRWEITPNEF